MWCNKHKPQDFAAIKGLPKRLRRKGFWGNEDAGVKAKRLPESNLLQNSPCGDVVHHKERKSNLDLRSFFIRKREQTYHSSHREFR